MNSKNLRIPFAACIGIFLFLFAFKSDAQVTGHCSLDVKSKQQPTTFTNVIDSKIDPADTDIIARMIEKSDYATFLKNTTSPTIYIMDLDQFRDGIQDFTVFGKTVKVLTKYELIDTDIPFYLTIDGYNKQQNTCEAIVSMHENKADGKISSTKKIVLKKSTDTWLVSN